MNEPKFPSEIGVIVLVRLLSLRRGPLNLSYLCASPLSRYTVVIINRFGGDGWIELIFTAYITTIKDRVHQDCLQQFEVYIYAIIAEFLYPSLPRITSPSLSN